MRRAIVLTAAVWVSACSGPSTARFDLATIELDFGFLAILDDADRVKRVTAIFGLENGELAFGEIPTLELDRGEPEQIVLVAMSAEELAGGYPGFEPARASQLGVSLMVPEVRGFEKEEGYFQRGELPAAARAHLAELSTDEVSFHSIESSILRGMVAIEVPVDPEYCRVPGQSPLQPFAGSADPFEDLSPRPFPDIRAVRWLDADRALVMTPTTIAVVRWKTPVEDGPGVLTLTDDRLRAVPASRLAIDTAASRALIAGSDGFRSLIWELEIRGEELVEISRQVHDMVLTDVAVLTGGEQIVAARDGFLFRRQPGTGELTLFEQLPSSQTALDNSVLLLAIDDPNTPLLAATPSNLHLYSAQTAQFSTQTLLAEGVNAFVPLTFTALAQGRSASGELELWAGAQLGYLFRRRDGGWTRVNLNYPDRFLPCADGRNSSGKIEFSGRFSAAAVDENYLHLGLSSCSAVVQVRRLDSCVSLLVPEHEVVGDTSGIRAVEVNDHRLIAGELGESLYGSSW